MVQKRVAADELNLRSDAMIGDNIIGVLRKGQPVDLEGESDHAGWVLVRADSRQGFVKAALLREPVSDGREALVSAAIAEWFRFDKGKGQEHHDPYFRYVGEMWKLIGMPDLDGKDRDVPWSAAFISWAVHKAGPAYDGFIKAAAHARYIRRAILAREAEKPAPFWGFRLHEHPVQLGDLICQWRESTMSYDGAVVADSYKSHCDIVVEISGTGVRAIGGNNAQTVGFKSYSRNPNGYLKADNNVFAVLRNNT